jgi:hypothetical protein
MHQKSLGGRAPPGPAVGADSAPPDPLAGSRGGDGERQGDGQGSIGQWRGSVKSLQPQEKKTSYLHLIIDEPYF